LRIDHAKKVLVLLLAAATFVAHGCSSRDVERGGSKQLDSAIALYITGQYEQAVDDLIELTGKLESDEDLRTAYLYLGRSYMSLGDYAAAADAFSSGRLIGGGIEFDQHLLTAQQHLRTTPKIIGAQEALTRAQMAALLYSLFGDEPQDDTGTGAADMQQHWAKTYMLRMQAAGVMEALPDGDFHPDAYVTYPAFYVTVLRSARAFDIPAWAIEQHFPGGFRKAISVRRSSRDPQGSGPWIPGREATEILQSLLKASE
jgi:tetratricopeptide (TPR) repeat protein